MIDSRDRNMDLYPDPSNYKIDLSDEFKDIREFELINVQMPSPIYTINKNNDQLRVYYGDHETNITLLHGVYNKGCELAKSLETSLNSCHNLIHKPSISVIYIERLQKLLFRSHNLIEKNGNININGLITFAFQGNKYPYGDGNHYETCLPDQSCGDVLGFSAKIYDMFAGLVAINEIDNDDPTYMEIMDNFYNNNNSDSNSDIGSDIGNDIGNAIGIDRKCVGNCDDKIYYMRQLDGNIIDKLKIPCNSSSNNNKLVTYVDTVYIRRCDSNNPSDFIPANIYHENSCLAREGLVGWLVTINQKYNLLCGQYELFVDYIISDHIIDLNPHKYLLLEIPKCHRINSIDSRTRKSFSKIPLQVPEYQFTNINTLGNIKYFNPVLSGLNKLHIKFYPYKKRGDLTNNMTFDFAGGEHVLLFAFVHYKQALKYGT